jgi:hypothetical protein
MDLSIGVNSSTDLAAAVVVSSADCVRVVNSAAGTAEIRATIRAVRPGVSKIRIRDSHGESDWTLSVAVVL